jgi:hypothetical protein
MSVTVAGGILPDQTVLEKNSLAGRNVTVGFMSPSGSQPAAGFSPAAAFLRTPPLRNDSPLSMEQYVLLSTLRI